MEFGIEKTAVLKMKSEKRQTAERIDLPNQEIMRTLEEKENFNYLGIFEANTIKQTEKKEKICK